MEAHSRETFAGRSGRLRPRHTVECLGRMRCAELARKTSRPAPMPRRDVPPERLSAERIEKGGSPGGRLAGSSLRMRLPRERGSRECPSGSGMTAMGEKGSASGGGRRPQAPVALIGYMGSGKTTIGRSLSYMLRRNFVDLDDEVERRADRSIPEIFASSGEKHFRDLEHKALRRALERSDSPVVSCGGGIVIRPENRALLKKARTVFLEEDLDVLFTRTRGAGRPLRGGGKEEFEQRYRERLPLYRDAAALIVAVAGRSQEEVAEEVEHWLKQ